MTLPRRWPAGFTPGWVSTRPRGWNRIWLKRAGQSRPCPASSAWEATHDIGNYAVTPHRRSRRRLWLGHFRLDPAAGARNLIDGIAAIAQSHIFTPHAHYVLGNLRAWGWIALILGILQLLAGAGAMAGNQLARWTGVGLVSLNLIAQMFFLPGYPFWSLMIIAVDVVALYALCVYGSRENLAV